MFPEAPLYTLINDKGSTSPIIEARQIHTSFLNNFPGAKKHYRKFLPLFPMAADGLKILEDADLVISSSHCVIKGVKKPQDAKHICYIHSPMRYVYDQFDNYFGPNKAPLIQRVVAHLIRPYLQIWDRNSNSNVDLFLANSNFFQLKNQVY